jgi:prepilin-type N-terminal cleavage/methylation domain-containing protein
MPHRLANERGFTLTELLVVVGIIVLLTAIVVPNIVGRIDKAKMHAAEDQIAEIETALAAYYADFGRYPGDEYPSEDLNNDGVLEPNEDTNDNGSLDAGEDLNGNSVLDVGEDTGVDIDGDGAYDYACHTDGTAYANRRLDHGDGVINIDDLEWALKTTAKNGPYLKEIPLDPWNNKYVYYAPVTRPTYNSNDSNDMGNKSYLWIDPADDDSVGNTRTLCTEDVNGNGKLDSGEDVGIADYDYLIDGNDYVRTSGGTSFIDMRAGAGNGILDHGDDDNKDNNIQTRLEAPYPHDPTDPQTAYELGNADVSPDGLARNIGYYVYSIGRNKKDETATGYEDINRDMNPTPSQFLTDDTDPATFDEDADGGDNDGTLDTGYEDTGVDGIPGTKDHGEGDGALSIDPTTPTETEDFTGPYNTAGELDTGGDDINSWNKQKPWRKNSGYGG